MTSRLNNCFEIRLRNVSGVPVIALGGNITKHAFSAIKFNLERLASAGHCNIVLNFERAIVRDWQVLEALSDAIGKIRSHYGCVDIVASKENLLQVSKNDHLASLFRLCSSEGQAIFLIKRLLRQPDNISETNARLVENM